jgi:glycogen debranching enzyme
MTALDDDELRERERRYRAFVQASVAPPAAARAARRLIEQAGDGGMDTSAGLLFNHSVWGRDRIITALDLLDHQPEVARAVIVTLAALQGTRRHALSEEEPGRIHSEYRDLERWVAPAYLRALFRFVISLAWGGNTRRYITYFASDSTPLYVILAAAYAEIDPSILAAHVRTADGDLHTIAETVQRAVSWIEGHIGADGLVEVPKTNVVGLQEVWKDGPTSNFDERGAMPNIVDPMVYLDIQVLAAEALARAAALLGGSTADRLRAQVRRLREATMRCFWVPEQRYFGFALDRDDGGRRRLLTAVQSNAGWMLNTGIFDDLPDAERREYVGGVIRMLFSPQMLTAVGVRGRSLANSNPAFRNYHENVWPVDTYMIAKGLRRQGFDELAEQLENRLLNAANMLGDFYEFVVVDDAGGVVHPKMTRLTAERLFGMAHALPSEMVPEETIAFTVTAILRIKRERASGEQGAPARVAARDPWVAALTAEILAQIESVPAYGTREELTEHFVALSDAYLSHPRGLLRSGITVVTEGFGGVLPRALVNRWRRRAGAGG